MFSSAVVQQVPPAQGSRAREEFQKVHFEGQRYLKNNKPARAIPLLERARSIEPSDFDNDYDLSEAYLQTGQLEKARAEALHLLTISNTADVHSLLGNIATANHAPKDAATEYQIAAHMDPSEDRIFDFGGSLLNFESDAAIRVFSYGVEKYPQSSLLRIGLGEAYDVRGDYRKAVVILSQAADMAPDDPRTLDFLGKLIDLTPEETKQIDQRFVNFLKSHPENANISYYLARDLLNPKGGSPSDDDESKGQQLLKAAIQLDPKLAGAYFELGRLQEKKGQAADAIVYYNHAIALNPDEETYHYRLSQVYKATGRTEDAKREFKAFQRLRAAKDSAFGPKDLAAPASSN